MFFREHVLVADEQLYESGSELRLVHVSLVEIHYNRLQEVLDACLAVLLDQTDEGALVCLPSLDDVVLLARVEAGAEEDPVAELGSETLLGCDQFQLRKDRINLANVFKKEGM
jgi:hypothetical protein